MIMIYLDLDRIYGLPHGYMLRFAFIWDILN